MTIRVVRYHVTAWWCGAFVYVHIIEMRTIYTYNVRVYTCTCRYPQYYKYMKCK